jgi:hypothetical protein
MTAAIRGGAIYDPHSEGNIAFLGVMMADSIWQAYLERFNNAPANSSGGGGNVVTPTANNPQSTAHAPSNSATSTRLSTSQFKPAIGNFAPPSPTKRMGMKLG